MREGRREREEGRGEGLTLQSCGLCTARYRVQDFCVLYHIVQFYINTSNWISKGKGFTELRFLISAESFLKNS